MCVSVTFYEDTSMSFTACWKRKTMNDGCMMNDTNELNIWWVHGKQHKGAACPGDILWHSLADTLNVHWTRCLVLTCPVVVKTQNSRESACVGISWGTRGWSQSLSQSTPYVRVKALIDHHTSCSLLNPGSFLRWIREMGETSSGQWCWFCRTVVLRKFTLSFQMRREILWMIRS